MMTNYEYMKDYYKFTNWRHVASSNRPRSIGGLRSHFTASKKGLWILMGNYRNTCFIYGLTIREFLRISKSGDYRSFIDCYWDTPTIANCATCNGAGKLDWISRIVGPPPFDKIRHKYVRDKSKIITYQQHNKFLEDQMFAPTKIFRSERICEDCMGTGMYILKDNIHKLMIYNINDIDTEGKHEE